MDPFAVLGNFNSHTREGVTGLYAFEKRWAANFNSHTREGVTPKM